FEPPVGASNVTASGFGAAGSFAVHEPDAALQTQPGGLALSGHSSSAPYLRPTTTGSAFPAGVLIVMTNRIPDASARADRGVAAGVSCSTGLPPPCGMLI